MRPMVLAANVPAAEQAFFGELAAVSGDELLASQVGDVSTGLLVELYAGGFTFSQLTAVVERLMRDWLEVNRTRSNKGVRVEAFHAIKDCHKYAELDWGRLPSQSELFAQELHSIGFEIVGLVDSGDWLGRLGSVFALLMYLVPATQMVAMCWPGEYVELRRKAAYAWHTLGLLNLEVTAHV